MNGAVVTNTCPARKARTRWMNSLGVLLIVGMSVALSGCPWFHKNIVVPDFDTAREQAYSANLQYERARQTLEKKQQQIELKKAVVALQTVVDRFPDDREYTPASQVTLGRVYLLLEDPKGAEKAYRTAIRNYSDIPDVHATALYGMAEAFRDLHQPEDENEYYKRLIETYADSDNPTIQQMVTVSRRRYMEVKTRDDEGVLKKKQ